MAWAHICSMGGGMANQWEYRETLRAHFGINEERTVDQVIVDRERAREARKPKRTAASRKGMPAPPADNLRGATPSQMDQLRAMLKDAKPRTPPATE